MLALAALALTAASACGAERSAIDEPASVGNGHMTLIGAWIRPTPPVTNVGAFYLTIRNEGDGSVRMIAASSPRCAEIEIHQTTTVDGVATMALAPAHDLELDPGQDLVFEPTGLHVMCLGLDRPVEQGELIPLTVDFDQTGSLTIEAEAENR